MRWTPCKEARHERSTATSSASGRRRLAGCRRGRARPVVAESAYQRMLIEAGIEPTPDSNPDEFRRSLAADVALWTPIVKALALKID